METIRAFLALDLSHGVRGRIMELEEKAGRVGADVKLVEGENLHVTMKFLGEIGPEKVETVHCAMKAVREKPFQLEAVGTGVFPNPRMPRVLWVGVGKGSNEVISIFRQLETQLSAAGFQKERNFTPHITIGRVRSPIKGHEMMGIMDAYRSTSFGITPVDKVVLKRSQLSSAGPIYSNLLEVGLQP